MGKRIFKAWGEQWLRKSDDAWLLVHKDGDYQYRNPDSVYVHRFATFKTREEAVAYLDERVARADHDEWRLYQERAT